MEVFDAPACRLTFILQSCKGAVGWGGVYLMLLALAVPTFEDWAQGSKRVHITQLSKDRCLKALRLASMLPQEERLVFQPLTWSASSFCFDASRHTFCLHNCNPFNAIPSLRLYSSRQTGTREPKTLQGPCTGGAPGPLRLQPAS